MEKDLEARIKNLEDIEAIRQEKSRYVYALDDRDWQGVVDHFTDDAKVDFGAFGKYEGRKELEQFFLVDFPPTIIFTLHRTQNDIIQVEGDLAKARFYMHESLTLTDGNQASWCAARYEDVFARVDGQWRCKESDINIYFLSPFEDGWVKKRMPDGME